MIVQFITIIIVLEIVDFVLSYIMPKKHLKGAYENAINMIIFSLIIVLCISILTQGEISIFSLGDIVKTNEIETYAFDEYIKIYRELIFDNMLD